MSPMTRELRKQVQDTVEVHLTRLLWRLTAAFISLVLVCLVQSAYILFRAGSVTEQVKQQERAVNILQGNRSREATQLASLQATQSQILEQLKSLREGKHEF